MHVLWCLHGGLSGLFHDKTKSNEFFSFIRKVNYFGGYTGKRTLGVKRGMRIVSHCFWAKVVFGGRPLDAIHWAPRSSRVNSETTHIGRVKDGLWRPPDMNVDH